LDPQIEHLVWFLNLPVFQKEFEAILVASVIFILVFSVFFSTGSKISIKNKGGMEKFFSMLPGFLLIITVSTCHIYAIIIPILFFQNWSLLVALTLAISK